ncbi:MAG: archaeosortase/exosortase family protein [Bacteroidota bacterium]
MPSSKKKHRKSGIKKGSAFNPLNSFNQFLNDRHPIFKFLLGFIGCMVLFYLLYYSSFYKNVLELPFLEAQANISNALLRLLGHDTTVENAMIFSSEFAVNIKNGCDGLEAIAILVSGVLIFPASVKLKLSGITWGVITLFLLNLLRIAGLYLIGLNFSPTVFEIMHVQGGFILFTMISVILLFIWINWAVKKSQQY